MDFGSKNFDSFDAFSVTENLDSLILPTEDDDLSRIGSSLSMTRHLEPKTTKI